MHQSHYVEAFACPPHALLWLTGFLMARKANAHHVIFFFGFCAGVCMCKILNLMIPWMICITTHLHWGLSIITHSGLFTPPPPSSLRLVSVREGKMVKLGNFSEKNNGKVVSEDGFDTIPLITPLDASQLQFPPPDKVRLYILYFPLIWRVTVRGPYRTDPGWDIAVFPPFQLGQLSCWKWRKTNIISRINPTLQLLWTHFLIQLQMQADWIIFHVCMCVVCFCQVVVKTKADYDGESKKGKLRSPKIAEFSISIIEGVSERLKVSLCFMHHPIFQYLSRSHTCICQRAVSLQVQDICLCCHHIPHSKLYSVARWLRPPSCPVSCCLSSCQVTQGDIMHNDSLNPALKLSLIQPLPWR